MTLKKMTTLLMFLSGSLFSCMKKSEEGNLHIFNHLFYRNPKDIAYFCSMGAIDHGDGTRYRYLAKLRFFVRKTSNIQYRWGLIRRDSFVGVFAKKKTCTENCYWSYESAVENNFGQNPDPDISVSTEPHPLANTLMNNDSKDDKKTENMDANAVLADMIRFNHKKLEKTLSIADVSFHKSHFNFEYIEKDDRRIITREWFQIDHQLDPEGKESPKVIVFKNKNGTASCYHPRYRLRKKFQQNTQNNTDIYAGPASTYPKVSIPTEGVLHYAGMQFDDYFKVRYHVRQDGELILKYGWLHEPASQAQSVLTEDRYSPGKDQPEYSLLLFSPSL